jgi:hypothetical protein
MALASSVRPGCRHGPRGAGNGEYGVALGFCLERDPDDAANAILGAAMIATLARWDRGDDSTSLAYQQALTDQIVRGVLPA